MSPRRDPDSATGSRGRKLVEATVVGASVSGLSGLLGLGHQFAPLREPQPVVHIAPWQWADPVSAILRFGGWSFEDAVYDPRVVAEFRRLRQVWESLQELREHRERRREFETVLWWRRQGCPVPGPLD